MRVKRSFNARILVGIAVSLMLLAGCSHSSDASVTSPPAETSATPERLTFVALGDSWPEGAHCGYCETFTGRYADGLKTLAGRPIDFVDLTGDAQPFFHTDGGGTASLLRALREKSSFADQVASGDVIMIATGPNEGDRAFGPYTEGRCGEGFACVQQLQDFWLRNFDAILDEIGRLRGDRPTVIRLVSAANFFVSDPSATQGLPPDAMEFGARYFEALNTAECDAARKHNAICVDVRPILNGPTLDQPVDENSAESMQAVADALLATGLPEFERWFQFDASASGAIPSSAASAHRLCSIPTVPLSSAVTAPAAPSSGSARTYITNAFLPGMTVTLPGDGSIVPRDTSAEFALQLADHPHAAIYFWVDPTAYDSDHEVSGVSDSPASLLAWLKSNPKLVIRDQTRLTIDDGLQALSFDLDLSATAPKEDPSCPTLCYSYLSVNEPREPYGTAKGERAHMYLTTIGSGATSHILLIVLDNGDPADPEGWTQLTRAAKNVLASLQLPTVLPPRTP